MVEFIILFCLVLFLIILIFFFNKGSSCIQDQTIFPELYLFQKFSSLVQKDLINIIKSDKWIDNSVLNKDVNNIIAKSINNDRIVVDRSVNFIENNYETLDPRVSTIKTFFFYLSYHIFTDNVIICPSIIALINGVPNVLAAYIKCIKPNTVSSKTFSAIPNTYICTIPLSPIDYKEGITIEDEVYEYKDLLMGNKYFILDGNCKHQLWNFTPIHKFILFIIVSK